MQNALATLLRLDRAAPDSDCRVRPAEPPVPSLRPWSNVALSRWQRAIGAEMKYRLGGPDPEEKGMSAIAEVDELGVLQAQLAPLLRREKALKDELKAMGKVPADGPLVLEGALFRVTISESLEERADLARIREEMGADWVKARSKILVKTTLRCGAKTGAQPQAKAA